MKNSTWLNKGLPLLSFILFLLIWYLISFFYNPVIVPSPLETALALADLLTDSNLIDHVKSTITRGLSGFALSVIVGTSLGLAIGLNSVLQKIFQPFLVTIQVTPIISWLVLAMIWFGFERVPVFIVFITTLPLVIINVVQGLANVNPKLTEMAVAFGVAKRSLIINVYLPQVIPYLFAAISAALGTTWKAVAMAEFLSSQKGIGAGMAVSRINLETAEVFAYTLLLITLGLITDQGLSYINKRLSAWRYII